MATANNTKKNATAPKAPTTTEPTTTTGQLALGLAKETATALVGISEAQAQEAQADLRATKSNSPATILAIALLWAREKEAREEARKAGTQAKHADEDKAKAERKAIRAQWAEEARTKKQARAEAKAKADKAKQA